MPHAFRNAVQDGGGGGVRRSAGMSRGQIKGETAVVRSQDARARADLYDVDASTRPRAHSWHTTATANTTKALDPSSRASGAPFLRATDAFLPLLAGCVQPWRPHTSPELLPHVCTAWMHSAQSGRSRRRLGLSTTPRAVAVPLTHRRARRGARGARLRRPLQTRASATLLRGAGRRGCTVYAACRKVPRKIDCGKAQIRFMFLAIPMHMHVLPGHCWGRPRVSKGGWMGKRGNRHVATWPWCGDHT